MKRAPHKTAPMPALAFLNSGGWPILESHLREPIGWYQESPNPESGPALKTSLDAKRLRCPDAHPMGTGDHSRGYRDGWLPGTVLRIHNRLAVVIMVHWLHYPVVDILGFVTANPEAARGALWAAIAGASRLDTLILGPTGTGKERIAHVVHRAFCLANGTGPFVPINAGALTPTLFASELFGFERGAFTGAERSGAGAFRCANGGVLFLDEIADAAEGAQVALLRAVENREVRPVGGRNSQKVDLMVVAATNKILEGPQANTHLRQDLLHRLAGAVIHLSPLRHRKEDILPIACQMLATIGHKSELSPEVIAALNRAPWQGNIRQLQRVLRQAVVMSGGAEINVASIHSALNPLQNTRGPDELPSMPAIDREILRIGQLQPSRRRESWRGLGLSKSTFYRRLRCLRSTEIKSQKNRGEPMRNTQLSV